MSAPAYRIRSAPANVETEPSPEIEPAEAEPELDGPEHDPYYYGWRPSWEKTADGEEKRHWIPLTYQDLLDPQEDDVIAEDTIHRKVTEDLAGILERRYRGRPSVAVWRNLKILFTIPGLTTGPAPDISVVEGVEDRDRRRRSFRFGQEPGQVKLAIEVVSKSSVKKDYQDLLDIYAPLGVEEYVAIHPLGPYSEGPFQLTGWRLDPHAGKLRPIPPGPQGRIPSQTTGLLFGTGKDAWGLAVWDAATGERLRWPQEQATWQEQRAEQAEHEKQQAEQRAEQAEHEKQQAEHEKQQAERRNRELAVELERLRAQIRERKKDDDA